MQYVFTIQNECIQCIRCEINQNQTKMYSIKNAVENAGPPASVTKATRKCIINKNRIVFKMNVFNSFDVNSIKNVINKKCHQKCRAAMAKHPNARIRVLPFC